MPESRIRTSYYTRTITVWLNSTARDDVDLETTVGELEAYLAELRQHGALDGDKVAALSKYVLSARLTATFPIREGDDDA